MYFELTLVTDYAITARADEEISCSFFLASISMQATHCSMAIHMSMRWFYIGWFYIGHLTLPPSLTATLAMIPRGRSAQQRLKLLQLSNLLLTTSVNSLQVRDHFHFTFSPSSLLPCVLASLQRQWRVVSLDCTVQ